MQVKRQKVAVYAGIFLWLSLYGIVSLIIEVLPENKTLNMVLLISVFVILLGLLVATKFLVRDDMIHFSDINEKILKIWSYVTLVPIAVLILFDYIYKNNPNLTHIVKIVASSVLILVALIGTVYFGIIAFRHPKPPVSHSEIIDAEFEEKKEL